MLPKRFWNSVLTRPARTPQRRDESCKNCAQHRPTCLVFSLLRFAGFTLTDLGLLDPKNVSRPDDTIHNLALQNAQHSPFVLKIGIAAEIKFYPKGYRSLVTDVMVTAWQKKMLGVCRHRESKCGLYRLLRIQGRIEGNNGRIAY
jgi:hypothetical protein